MRGMSTRAIGLLTLAVAVCGARYAVACRGLIGADLQAFARQAVAENDAERSRAIEVLRQAGPSGLDALFVAHRAAILSAEAADQPAGAAGDSAWERLRQALDAVGGQRDCAASHLYWYTDLDQAKAAAQQSGKPILSLRMLGKLTDEYSCANSRFFRSTLYANQAVSRLLRDRFVLHWQSERPVPVVDHRLWRWPQVAADRDRQQRPLRARRRGPADRRPARLVRPRGLPARRRPRGTVRSQPGSRRGRSHAEACGLSPRTPERTAPALGG